MVKDTVRHLLNDQDHDVGKDIDRIQNYDTLLSILPWRKIQDLLLAVIVAAVCMGIMWFLWSSRMTTNKIFLNIQTKHVKFHLDKAPQKNDQDRTNDKGWTWEGDLKLHPGEGLRVRNLMPDDVAKKHMKKLRRNFYLHSGTGKLGLKELRATVDGAITIGHNENDLLEVIYNGQTFSSMFYFQKDVSNPALSVPEDGTFQWERGSGPSPRLELELFEDWYLSNIPIRGISFIQSSRRKSDPGEQPVESGLIHGVLQYAEIDRKREFEEGDVLDLEGLKGRLVSIHIQKKEKLITLRFEGQVKKIIRGPRGFDENITPSILEYWFYKKSVAFFATLFISLMGFLWSLRKWLIS